MPRSALHACAVPGCGALLEVGGGARCPQHAVPNWRAVHRDTPPRIRGTHLQRLRRQLFDRYPLCVVCEQQGRVSVAVIRDHVVPLGEGGTETEDNTQALCQSCSDAKTREEAKRGMDRTR